MSDYLSKLARLSQVKRMAEVLRSSDEDIKDYIGELPEDAVSGNVVDYIDEVAFGGGSAHKARLITVTLDPEDWNDGKQTVTNTHFYSEGYAYFVYSPVVRAEDVTTDEEMVFTCSSTLTESVTAYVLVLEAVTSSGKSAAPARTASVSDEDDSDEDDSDEDEIGLDSLA